MYPPTGLSRIQQDLVSLELITVPGTRLTLNKWFLLCVQGKKAVLNKVLAAFIPSGWDYGYNEHPLLL